MTNDHQHRNRFHRSAAAFRYCALGRGPASPKKKLTSRIFQKP